MVGWVVVGWGGVGRGEGGRLGVGWWLGMGCEVVEGWWVV